MNAGRLKFALTGPSTDLDPRVNAIRGDLADAALAGQLFAPHYAEPAARSCARAFAAVLDSPGGKQVSELLAGDGFMLLDAAGGWAWGWCAHDHYVGYVEAAALATTPASPSPAQFDNAVDAARSFLGLAYLWGGRGGAGIDCSGLIQRSLAAEGLAAPRDSDMQRAALGRPVPVGEPIEAGDLIFFPGHVGMMVDGETLIHATRHHGAVVEELLSAVTVRIAAKRDGVGMIAHKRL
jgi:cell wall-associated NlpC family hydrolase